MASIDKYMWEELKANSQAEYEQRKQDLKTVVETFRPKLDAITSFDDFILFCKDFTASNQHTRPIGFWPEGRAVTAEDIALLQSLGYPEDFLQWHRQFGQTYLWLESTTIYPTERLIKELRDDWFALLTQNGYLLMTGDGGGNAVVYDMNSYPPAIKFADHETTYTSLSHLEELYSEEYEFWLDSATQEYVNRQGLDIAQIFDAQGNYRIDSIYVKQYLAQAMEIEPSMHFLEYLISHTIEGMDDVLHRYDIV